MRNKNVAGFLLRLPKSTRSKAAEIAKEEGVSLNQFITLAVAEKLIRLAHSHAVQATAVTDVLAAQGKELTANQSKRGLIDWSGWNARG